MTGKYLKLPPRLPPPSPVYSVVYRINSIQNSEIKIRQ